MSKGRVSLTGVHLLLTYKCDGECDHCFVWSSPSSAGTMSVRQIERLLAQAAEIPTVRTVYFEGGEPFLFYPVLAEGVELARASGFEVGIVSNAYWATDREDAMRWLSPLAEHGIADLTLSADEYHGTGEEATNVRRARSAARRLKVPVGTIEIRGADFYACEGREAPGGELYFRGRAAEKLAPKARKKRADTLTTCPEEPPNISRVHIDAFGNAQFCQGITIGNVWRRPLRKIVDGLDPESHPVIGPLIRGGPAAMAAEHGLKARRGYADACHMCYEMRKALRAEGRFRRILTPDQAYGAAEEERKRR